MRHPHTLLPENPEITTRVRCTERVVIFGFMPQMGRRRGVSACLGQKNIEKDMAE